MTTFAQKSFSAANYAAGRPPPPPHLISYITSLVPPPHRTILDIGCGPGTATLPFASSTDFSSVLGFDASEVMISQAKEAQTGGPYEHVRFSVAAAEKIPVEDGSVDLVIAQTAAHWFDIPAWKKEMARIVRPGGVLAVWGYIDGGLKGAEKATVRYVDWIHDEDKLGPYWEWSGKEIMRRWYKDIVFDGEEWEDRQYWYHKASGENKEVPPKREGETEVQDGKAIFEFKTTLKELKDFFNTWSGTHRWKQAHPEAVSKDQGGDGDIIDAMLEDMVRSETSWGYTEEEIQAGAWKDKDVDFVWDSTVLVARRKAA